MMKIFFDVGRIFLKKSGAGTGLSLFQAVKKKMITKKKAPEPGLNCLSLCQVSGEEFYESF